MYFAVCNYTPILKVTEQNNKKEPDQKGNVPLGTFGFLIHLLRFSIFLNPCCTYNSILCTSLWLTISKCVRFKSMSSLLLWNPLDWLYSTLSASQLPLGLRQDLHQAEPVNTLVTGSLTASEEPVHTWDSLPNGVWKIPRDTALGRFLKIFQKRSTFWVGKVSCFLGEYRNEQTLPQTCPWFSGSTDFSSGCMLGP